MVVILYKVSPTILKKMGDHKSVIRLVAIVAAAVGCIMFFIGASSDHWAKNGGDHWGLWNYCINTTTLQNHSNHLNTTFTTTTAHSLSDKEEEDEDDSCGRFSFSEIPGALHLVRALMVMSALAIAYSILGGKILLWHSRVEWGKSFLSSHKGEIACITAGLVGIAGIYIFRLTFKYFDFEVDHHTFQETDDLHEGWSIGASYIGCFLMISGSLVLLFPSILERWRNRHRECFNLSWDDFSIDPLGACYRCFICKEQHRPQSQTSPTELEVHAVSFTGDSTADADFNSNMFVLNVDSRNSSQNSSNSSLSITLPLNDDAPYAEPAPRYEDLSPREEVGEIPPPPSYDEAITGQYSVANTSISSESSASASASHLPSHGIRLNIDVEPPPPSYDESRV